MSAMGTPRIHFPEGDVCLCEQNGWAVPWAEQTHSNRGDLENKDSEAELNALNLVVEKCRFYTFTLFLG